jgi:muramoyltetrapeptide carboxypeptidase LdcA involved in peptidoglycan recycling
LQIRWPRAPLVVTFGSVAVRFPVALKRGDRVGVTAPSSGVAEDLRARLDVAVKAVEARGYEVVIGDCMGGSGHLSAPAPQRAAELTSMLTDPAIRAVVPPWGGETAIDLLPLLDWAAISRAEPTWMVGFSDVSTIITPLTLLTGMATVHGNNLMDTPYQTPRGLLSWLDIVAADPGTVLGQVPPGRHRAAGHDDYQANPRADVFTLDQPGRWTRLDGDGDVVVEGRLIGGCIETLCNVAGTPFGDVAAFARQAAPDGMLVYVEACCEDAFAICRYLHGMRLAGFFAAANAVLVGRTRAPATASLTQHEAVLDALGCLGVPLIADVECGHVPPYMPIVNGAHGRLVCTSDHNRLDQTLA